MKTMSATCFLAGVLWGLVFVAAENPHSAASPEISASYGWKLPDGYPIPQVPSDNPMTEAKVDLGRHLFYDPRLSLDQSMSCASCHQQSRAFSDGKVLPTGVTGDVHPRHSMALVNVGYQTTLNWANPNTRLLETQMLTPLFGEHPTEMGMVGQEALLLKRLKKEPLYQIKFAQAFPKEKVPINILNITRAIASFERQLISYQSSYDRYVYQDENEAISASAKRGEGLFFSEKLECFHCHGGFNFSDTTTHSGSAFPESSFHNTGLYNLDQQGAYPKGNQGVFDISGLNKDIGRFKAPTLRNIEVTAPYMHDGSIATLEEVIAHYAAGGRTIAQGPHAGVGALNPHKSGFVKGFTLSEQEQTDLLAFLKSLTDTHFLTRKDLGDPFAK